MKNAFRAICFLIGSLAFSACAQISPATRPHTHSGSSSGGSTLNPATLNVTGTFGAPSVSATTSVITPLVGPATDIDLVIANAGVSAWIFRGSPNNYDLLPSFGSNSQSIGRGSPANVIKQIFTPIVDTGTAGSGVLKTNNGTTVFTWANDLSVTFAGTASSTKACASGYTRVGPNYCRANALNFVGWTDAIACTGRTQSVSAIPAGATAANITIVWNALANNAIAQRTNSVIFYSDAGCTVQVISDTYEIREFAAVVAGTVIGVSHVHMIVPLSGTNTISATQTNAGGNGNSDIAFFVTNGYFD